MAVLGADIRNCQNERLSTRILSYVMLVDACASRRRSRNSGTVFINSDFGDRALLLKSSVLASSGIHVLHANVLSDRVFALLWVPKVFQVQEEHSKIAMFSCTSYYRHLFCIILIY